MQTSKVRKHGTHACYSKGCRCDSCKVAHREYERDAKRRRSRAKMGIDFYEPRTIDATEVVEHMKFLSSKGFGAGFISARTGLDRQNLLRIRRGEQRTVTREVADKVLSVPALASQPNDRVSSKPLKKLIKKLNKKGVTDTDIGRQAGYKDGRLNLKPTVRLHKYLRIENACAELLRSFND